MIGYQPSDINKNIKEVKLPANKIALRDVKEVYLDLKKIYNISALLKLNNSDHYIIRIEIKQKKQLTKCLTILKALPTKLNSSFKY